MVFITHIISLSLYISLSLIYIYIYTCIYIYIYIYICTFLCLQFEVGFGSTNAHYARVFLGACGCSNVSNVNVYVKNSLQCKWVKVLPALGDIVQNYKCCLFGLADPSSACWQATARRPARCSLNNNINIISNKNTTNITSTNLISTIMIMIIMIMFIVIIIS